MASMAPMASSMAAPRSTGSRILVLRVSEPSWVELTASDGRRLEYAQLQAGTTREYVVDGGADLVVGNVPGVIATLNGRSVDLNAVANRNVARMRVGDAAPAAGQ
jgi:cytoskeleton protein RodZ